MKRSAQAAHPRRPRGLRGADPQILPDVLRLHQGHDQGDRRGGGHHAEYLLKVWLNRERLDAAKSIRNYLFVLAKHEIYNYFRTKSRTFTTLKEAIVQAGKQGGGEFSLRETKSRRSSIWRRPPSRSRPSSERCPRSGSRFSACRVSSTCRAGRSPNS